jgi:hypothetical protein
VGTILFQFFGLSALRFSRGNCLELFFISSLVSLSQSSVEGSGWNYSSSVLWSLCPKVLYREVFETILHLFSGLSVPKFSRGKWLEIFFISSLVCQSQGSQEGSALELFFISSLVSLSQGSLEGSTWNYSSSVLWSLCPKVLYREVVETILHLFSGLSVPKFSRGKWLELFFISSLVCQSQGSQEGSALELFFISSLVSLSQGSLERSGW